MLSTSVSGEGRRIVLVHGFSQAGAVWADLVPRLDGFEVMTVDLPGHGTTPADYDQSDLWEAADALARTGGEAVYVGYSLGARVILHLALRHLGLVRGLVLVGAKGGYDDTRVAEERQQSDDQMAARVEEIGTERFVDEWLARPFNSRLSGAQRHREIRIRNRAAGLAASLRYCGSGWQQPLWDVVHRLDAPTLLITGEYDLADVTADNERLARILPQARHIVMHGVGHSAPFEATDRFADLIHDNLDWLLSHAGHAGVAD